MRSKPWMARRGRLAWVARGAACLVAAWAVHSAHAQSTTPTTLPAVDATSPAADAKVVHPEDRPATAGDEIKKVGCASCGLPPSDGMIGGGGCAGCGGNCADGCVPGRRPCGPCWSFPCDSCWGRACNGFIECLCCPDPCYEGHWTPAADAAFFVDSTRPVNTQRLRVDYAWDIHDPDRAEYFWAKTWRHNFQDICGRTSPVGTGPCVATRVTDEELRYYTEIASGNFALIAELPYKEVEPTAMAQPFTQANAGVNPMCCQHSGFGDVMVGTKTLLVDREMLFAGFEFKVFIPSGSRSSGLGTGHVSLEPSLLATLKVTCDDYIQMQSAYWIPISGDPIWSAPIWHNHASWNHVFWHAGHTFTLVGTAEVNAWSIFGGRFTVDPGIGDPNGNVGEPFFDLQTHSASTTILTAGPGLRLFICDRFDVGVGSAFAITGPKWAEEELRADLRFRF